MGSTYLIIHGLDGSPPGHWQSWLAAELRAAGKSVRFPELPGASRPDLAAWLEHLRVELVRGGPDTTLVAHSLGAWTWLRHASGALAAPARRVLLVAPPGQAETAASGRIARPPDAPLDAARIREAAGEILLVASAGDPCCLGGAAAEFAEPLGLDFLELPAEAGHINIASGFGPWPFALDWSLGRTRAGNGSAGGALSGHA